MVTLVTYGKMNRRARCESMFRNIVPQGCTKDYVVRRSGQSMYRTRHRRTMQFLRLADSVCFCPLRFIENLKFAAILNTRVQSSEVQEYLRQSMRGNGVTKHRPPRPRGSRAVRAVRKEYQRLLNRNYIHVKSQHYGVTDNIHRVYLNKPIQDSTAVSIRCTCQDVVSPCKHMLLIDRSARGHRRLTTHLRW